MKQTKEEKLAKARAYDRKRYADNPSLKKSAVKRYRDSAKGKQSRAKSRLSAYGLTITDYETLLNKQDGKCAICKTTQSSKTLLRRFYVDHNHQNGKVRGLLCCACNSWLGRVNDDPSVGERVTQYLLAGLNKEG